MSEYVPCRACLIDFRMAHTDLAAVAICQWLSVKYLVPVTSADGKAAPQNSCGNGHQHIDSRIL